MKLKSFSNLCIIKRNYILLPLNMRLVNQIIISLITLYYKVDENNIPSIKPHGRM